MDWNYIATQLADIFNKTALGLGVLLGGWLIWTGEYLRASVIFFVLVPIYFALERRFGPKRNH